MKLQKCKNLIFCFCLLLLASSCSYKSREIIINPTSPYNIDIIENESGNKFIASNIIVRDKRDNKNIIGKKKFGKKTVDITNSQNLSELIKEKIVKDIQKELYIFGKNKTLEISLISLKYKAKRGFIVGNSEIDILLKIKAKDKNFLRYSKSYGLESKAKHFIIPLAKTDQENINLALQELLSKISTDYKLINFLKPK